VEAATPDDLLPDPNRFVVLRIPGDAKPFGTKIAKLPRGARTRKTARAETYENQVRAAAIEAIGEREPIVGPVFVSIRCTFLRPASELRVKKTPGARFRTKTPDVDKVARLVLDALSGVVYRDDAEVAVLEIAKRDAEQDRSKLPRKVSTPASTTVIVGALRDRAGGERELLRRIFG
jgi:Holliday junction resolvase RusA-like endonuclease